MKQQCIIACFCGFLGIAMQLHAFAPIVDDSENFAVMDEQQTDFKASGAQNQWNDHDDVRDDIALAHDDALDKMPKSIRLTTQLHELQRELQELRGQLEI